MHAEERIRSSRKKSIDGHAGREPSDWNSFNDATGAARSERLSLMQRRQLKRGKPGKTRPWQDAVSTAAGTSADHTRELRRFSHFCEHDGSEFRCMRGWPPRSSARDKEKQSTKHVKGSSV